MPELSAIGALCLWPRCSCPGKCLATGQARVTPAGAPPVWAGSQPASPLGIENKLDALNESCSNLGLAIHEKADARRVAKVERAIKGVRWQLYAIAGVLAAAQVWLYVAFR